MPSNPHVTVDFISKSESLTSVMTCLELFPLFLKYISHKYSSQGSENSFFPQFSGFLVF